MQNTHNYCYFVLEEKPEIHVFQNIKLRMFTKLVNKCNYYKLYPAPFGEIEEMQNIEMFVKIKTRIEIAAFQSKAQFIREVSLINI